MKSTSGKKRNIIKAVICTALVVGALGGSVFAGGSGLEFGNGFMCKKTQSGLKCTGYTAYATSKPFYHKSTDYLTSASKVYTKTSSESFSTQRSEAMQSRWGLYGHTGKYTITRKML